MNIKILSGIHEGAELDLPLSGLIIGYGDDCDIELLDLGFELAVHISINDTTGLLSIMDEDRRCLLVGAKGQILDHSSEFSSAYLFLCNVIVYLGQFSSGAVITVPSSVEEKYLAFQKDANKLPEDETAKPVVEEPPSQAFNELIKAASPSKKDTSQGSKVGYLSIFGCLLLLGYLFFIILLPVTADSTAKFEKNGQTTQSQAHAPVVVSSGSDAPSADLEANDAEVDAALLWLNKAMESAKLSKYIEVERVAKAFSIKAVLSDKDTIVFEGILADWAIQFGSVVTLTAEVKKPINALPFKIREVNAGPNGWIVTADNEYLYVGGTYRGFRLERVEKNRILFGGKASLEIAL